MSDKPATESDVGCIFLLLFGAILAFFYLAMSKLDDIHEDVKAHSPTSGETTKGDAKK